MAVRSRNGREQVGTPEQEGLHVSLCCQVTCWARHIHLRSFQPPPSHIPTFQFSPYNLHPFFSPKMQGIATERKWSLDHIPFTKTQMTLQCLKIIKCLSLGKFPFPHRSTLGFSANIVCACVFHVCATCLDHRELNDFLVVIILPHYTNHETSQYMEFFCIWLLVQLCARARLLPQKQVTLTDIVSVCN
jgi:hypothetical protein